MKLLIPYMSYMFKYSNSIFQTASLDAFHILVSTPEELLFRPLHRVWYVSIPGFPLKKIYIHFRPQLAPEIFLIFIINSLLILPSGA